MYHARHADDPAGTACRLAPSFDKIPIVTDTLRDVSCLDCKRVVSARPENYRPTRRAHRYPRNWVAA